MSLCAIDRFRAARLHTHFFLGVAFCFWMGRFSISFAETLSGAPAEQSEENSKQRSSLPQRKFVRKWQVKDLRRELFLLGEGRSYEKGKELFTTATCAQCHRINEAGGTLGPDLTGVAGRNSRVVILQETIEPSIKLPELYRPIIVLTMEGRVHQGLIVRQDAVSITLANDPNNPEKVINIPRIDIDEKDPSTVSMMPEDLLNTLTKEEILDLLAYIESGGQEDHPAFDPIN